MKQINSPKEASKVLNIPLTTQNKSLIKPLNETKKPKRAKRPGEGRPTKYDQKYCKEIIAYFTVEHFEDKVVERMHTKSGDDVEKFKETANPLRFLSGFARSIGVTHTTLLEWRDSQPEFSVAFTRAKELQQEMMVSNALKGLYNPHFTIFATKNMIGWRDKTEIEIGIADETFEKYKQLSVQDLQKKLDELMPNRVAGLLT